MDIYGSKTNIFSLIPLAEKSAGEGEQQGTSCQINPRIFRCGHPAFIHYLTYQATYIVVVHVIAISAW